MEDFNLKSLVSVKGTQRGTQSMLTVAGALDEALKEEGALPAPHEDVFEPFQDSAKVLKDVMTERWVTPETSPELQNAANRVLRKAQVLRKAVTNEVDAAEPITLDPATRVASVLPENFSFVNGERSKWIGQVEVLANLLRTEYQADLESLHFLHHLDGLEAAITAYHKKLGEFSNHRTIPHEENLLVALNRCKGNLRDLVLLLVVLVHLQPSLQGKVQRILQPYINLVLSEKENRKKNRNAANDGASDNGEEEEEEEEETEEEAVEEEETEEEAVDQAS